MTRTPRKTDRDGLANKLEFAMLTGLRPVWSVIQRSKALKKRVNKTLINRVIYKIKTRPYPFSTMAPYTSWASLTDRSYSGRHLPARPEFQAKLPPVDEVAKIFARRPGQTILSGKSTLLFSHFAQWFTDGFLRTDRDECLKNTSNHEIDVCQLYGLSREVTNLIRSHQGGKLKSQQINGEEYPPYVFGDDGGVKPEFAGLPMIYHEGLPPERLARLFAMGGDRANVHIGYSMMNTLFLREHNRICDLLAREYPAWDDERLFQTARNIITVLVIKIVIEEYINHITPYHFKFLADPTGFTNERWYRQNWMSVEFNLVYRWHGLVPDTVRLGERDLPAEQTLFNNDLLTQRGLGQLFEDSSLQPAGEIGLFNTPRFLMPVEKASIEMGRAAQLASYNDYREFYRYPRLTSFDQLTSNVEAREALERLYGHVDNVELFVGLFAEDVRPNSAVGPLIGRCVGIDAFSQALTNPLLAEPVFNEQTFSPLGFRLIQETQCLADILHRNLPASGRRYLVTLTRRDATAAPEAALQPQPAV